jgi:uncharacterized protein YbjT (DUF2867 family)
MKIVMGSSGHVGKAVVERLLFMGHPTKAIIRNPEKKSEFASEKLLSIDVADAFDATTLHRAFRDGDTVFLLTPESGQSEDMLAEVKHLVSNYRDAIRTLKIKKLIGNSTVGAQHETGTGNLSMSYQLEHGFNDLDIIKIFVRPSYYYTNWVNYIPLVKEQGVLPTFFPADLKIPMCSPKEVGEFVAQLMADDMSQSGVYELVGPRYSSADIAREFSQVFGRSISVQEIPQAEWWNTIKGFGFSDDATQNFISMTEAVIDGRAAAEGNGATTVAMETSFSEFLEDHKELVS